MDLSELLALSFLNNTVQTWLTALLIFLVSTIGLQIITRFLIRRISKLSSRTKTDIDDLIAEMIQQTKLFFLLIISLYFATLVLSLPENVKTISQTVAIITLFIQTGFWGSGLISHFIKREMKERIEDDAASATMINALRFVGKVILWAILLLLALDNIPGVEVDSLIASLGVGGVAVALAVRSILSDIFASLSIAIDQPFVIGDTIAIDDFIGKVEHIGLKSTRIRSLAGEELVFSNTDLLESRIRNYKSMTRRRIIFSIGVANDTPAKKLAAIPDMIREIIEAMDDVTLDRVHFKEFGDFALIFEIAYYLETPDYAFYMDTQQAINMAILGKFEQEKIEMPYPTQTVLLEK